VKTGLFGGTFDPIHNGHLLAAREAADAHALERVIFIPAARSPHKGATTVSPGATRLAMVEAAIAGDARFECSRAELDRPPPSFSYDTVMQFKRERPADEFFLIVGSDSLEELHSWYKAKELVRLVRIVAVARPGWPMENFEKIAHRFGSEVAAGMKADALFIEGVDVSASRIRELVRGGRPIDDLVPPVVARIIEMERLYL